LNFGVDASIGFYTTLDGKSTDQDGDYVMVTMSWLDLTWRVLPLSIWMNRLQKVNFVVYFIFDAQNYFRN